MKLDKHVVDMFTELTKPADDVKMEKTCYGTISVVDGTRYVKLDGSDLLVPAASTVKTSHGDRVTVLMKNHSLTVTGNLTAPATDGEGGSSGEAGTAATIEVGRVTTGEAGSLASVTNSGTTSAAVFDFVIPRGDAGPQGPQGEAGTAATIEVGTVTTVEGAILASVTNSGTTSAAVFDFVIPRGEKGEKGEKGDTGTWDGTIPDHEHTISDITDFPTSLPANGGNAETLDGHHASDFSQIINLGHTSTDTKNALGIQYQTTAYWCFNWTDYPAGMYDGQGMIIAAHYNSYGTTVGVDSIWCRQIFISPHPNTKIYQRIIANTDVGEWTSISDGGNADTLDGLRANEIASNPNLLINPDFKINQRGLSIYDTDWAYNVDRWQAFGNIISVTDNGIDIKSKEGVDYCSLFQRVEIFGLIGKTITISSKINGTIYSGSVQITAYNTATEVRLPATSRIEVIYDASSTLSVQFYINPNEEWNIEWVKLELGSIATPFYPPDPATELAKCQRYYQIRSTGNIPAVDLRPSMRATPTVTRLSDGNYAYGAEL